MLIKTLKNNYSKILIIILLSIFVDILIIRNINSPPGWDQGYHLSNVFKMYNILEDININFSSKVDHLLNVTDSYRGPLAYLLSSIFLRIFNNSYFSSYLSNQLFNIICIFSMYKLGSLYKNKEVGIWASVIFTFSTLILNQRSDYLIDLSLTSFIILSFLALTKWYENIKNQRLYSILSGISIGLVFLTKPTGVIFFCLPILCMLIKLFKTKNNYISKINDILLFTFSFSLVIFPWFSRHWVTIISSTINAWNWGINYQEGLEANSISSWLFYIKKLPYVFGVLNFSIFLVIFLAEKIYKRDILRINIKDLKKYDLWFLSFVLNCYLVLSLMSTKDIRFILPMYPIICIYLSLFINSKKYNFFTIKIKKIILITSISISLLFSNNGLFIKDNKYKTFYKWPHSDVINEIKNENPNLISTLAMLPDTREINTFNMEAEASRQGEYVAVRQIVSNKKTYKEDLKYFDWFLVKTKDQGVMTKESKNLLNQYLLDNNSFTIHKEWFLPDKSKLILLKRKSINTNLLKKDCSKEYPILSLKQIENGINLNILGEGTFLNSSSLLIDLNNEEFKKMVNISLANGLFHRGFDNNKCYSLSQNISLDLPKNNAENLFIKARLINKDGKNLNLNLEKDNLIIEDKFIESNFIQMINRISKVETLGSFLKKGEFKNLFDLVGIINQSDPKQQYLKDAENIYLRRYEDTNNLKDLYSVLISQILQRKIVQAEETVNLILDKDTKNGNAYLTKSIINLYLFDKANTRASLNKAKSFEKSLESNQIIKIVEGLNYLLEMKFINAYKNFFE